MNKQKGIEEIQKHLEAIMEVARRLGTDDYLSMCIMNDEGQRYMTFNNDYQGRHRHDGRALCFTARDGGWSDYTESSLMFLEEEE